MLQRLISALVLITLTTLSAAGDPPDCELNGVTGNIECVDSTFKASTWDIRWAVDVPGGLPLDSEMVTDTAETESEPRLSIRNDGHRAVTWTRETAVAAVMFRSRPHPAGGWADEKQVSANGEDSADPEITSDGSKYWIAYTFDAGGGEKGIAVNGIDDSPDPIPQRFLITTTGYAGDVDVQVQYTEGHLWVSWVHDSQDVGWVEYDYASETWSTVGYESTAVDSVKEARARILAQLIAS